MPKKLTPEQKQHRREVREQRKKDKANARLAKKSGTVEELFDRVNERIKNTEGE
jgi:hypothetical protein